VTLRLASYNIRFGGVGRAPRIAAVLAGLRPDLVVLQEATNAEVVAEIARTLEFPTVVAFPGQSVAIVSRVPVAAMLRPLEHRRAAVAIRLEVRGAASAGLEIVGVHLSAGLSRRGENRRLAEVRGLLDGITSVTTSDAGDAASAPDRPGVPSSTIILGDFNAITAGDAPLLSRLPLWIRLLLRFDGGIRTSAMTLLSEHGFIDAYRLIHPDEPGCTMPAVEPSVRLDYVLVAPHLVACLRSCHRPEASRELSLASDHLPLVAEFDLAPLEPSP
jgi:endonuclease/exonuclease/phosphatase family metal-dependent hydrolase